MLYSNNFKVNSSEIFKFFNKSKVHGFREIELSRISSLDNPSNNSIFFIKKNIKENLALLKEVKDSIFFVNEVVKSKENIIIKTSNPRLDFTRFVEFIYNNFEDKYSRGKLNIKDLNIIISESAVVHKSAKIFPNVYIGPNTTIGKNTLIYPNVTIIGNTLIDANCIIGANSVIGNQGFGGERGENDEIFMMPHLGGVVIDKNVRVGANNTIVSGTINPTRIGEYTKLDDHVHFAHNCIAGKYCFITACVQFSGSIVLGDRVWIGPNTSIIQGIKIEDDATIGIGAVVTKNVATKQVVAGNPALDIETLKKQRKFLKNL